MGKFLGIDTGKKRTGLALSDELAMIASPWKTVNSHELTEEIAALLAKERISGFVIGLPTDLRNRDTDGTQIARHLEAGLRKKFPGVPVHFEDERFSSKIALQSMISADVPRMKRRDKAMIDKVSAAIILQSFLDRLARQK